MTLHDREMTGPAQLLQRAIRFHQEGALDKAERLYQQLLKKYPDNFDALHMLGVIRGQQGRIKDALGLIGRALAARPGSAEAHSNFGNSLQSLERYEEALTSYERALAIRPADPRTLNNRGNALQRLGRYHEALSSHDKAMALNPRDAEILNSRGSALAGLNRLAEAAACCERALLIKPDYVEAHMNRGRLLGSLDRPRKAIEHLDAALRLQPNHAETLFTRALVLVKLGRLDEAIAGLRLVLTLDPGYPLAYGELIKAKLSACSWSELANLMTILWDRLASGRLIVDPMLLLRVPSPPSEQMRCGQTFLDQRIPISSLPEFVHGKAHRDRLRIAYLSADFRDHPVGSIVSELFELHDRKQFDVFGISFGPDDRSSIRERIAQAFDRFIDVRSKTDEDVARLLHELEVDVAVDLMGHTEGARPGILALRPVPVQVSYLGFPGTTGAHFMDYVVADATVLPFDQQPFYMERIVHLPDCYLVNDSHGRQISHTPSRAQLGLPDNGFVFCAFTQSDKITPPVFGIWMRLLESLDGSVLWLSTLNEDARRNLRDMARAHGVDPDRLIFAPRVPLLADHLARHRRADLFLDTLPYNAHTTASNALWAGLPVVTCLGETFAGRVGASLLRTVGLPELVTHNLEEYHALALTLATEPAEMQSVRRKLEIARTGSTLFDSQRFCRNIEAAYRTMWDLYQRGEPPRSFQVEPASTTAQGSGPS